MFGVASLVHKLRLNGHKNIRFISCLKSWVLKVGGLASVLVSSSSFFESKRPVILCFVAYYLPGFRSGGPVRTIENFVDHLGDEFDIRIVCSDRDVLDTNPYPSVAIDSWNTVGKARVFYASSQALTLLGVARLLRDTRHDILYLNSFFSFCFTTLPLLARWFYLAPRKPVVLAPRGEFSQGAINLKILKKRTYLWLVRIIGLYRKIHWQASSEFELSDIRRELSHVARSITVAPDLPSAGKVISAEISARPPGPLRVVFLSRISPIKNLDFLLTVTRRVKEAIELIIFGPADDPDYWCICERLISLMPKHCRVEYAGEVSPTAVHETFAKFDVFAFPTSGENFGHVILESLSAGTPVLVSDRTPWRPDSSGAITLLSLNEDLWLKEIRRWANKSEAELLDSRVRALAYANAYISNSSAVTQNRLFFSSVMLGRENI